MELSCLTPSIIETYLTHGLNKKVAIRVNEKDSQVIFDIKKGQGTLGEQITYYKKKDGNSVVIRRNETDELQKDLLRLDNLLATRRPKVFIDYAYKNRKFKDKVKSIVQDMGFEPLVLEEQQNHTQVLLEKLENLIYEADYGLVLLGADDKLADKDAYHPRPNVMLELGLLLAHLKHKGKGNKRISLINCAGNLEGKLDIPSDILGLAFTRHSSQNFEENLIKELVHLYQEVEEKD